MHGFRLIRNKKFIDFFTSTIDQTNAWFDALSKYCILSNFENDYKIIRKIGKGTFASVFEKKNIFDFNFYCICIYFILIYRKLILILT